MGSILTKIKEALSLSCCCPSYFHSTCCSDEGALDIEIKNNKMDKQTECSIFECFKFKRNVKNHDENKYN